MKRIILLTALLCTDLFARPNPAYLYCIQNGGVMETREDSQGNQDGVCMFNKDGIKSECGQWSYFRGDCAPGQCKLWTVETNSCIEPI